MYPSDKEGIVKVGSIGFMYPSDKEGIVKVGCIGFMYPSIKDGNSKGRVYRVYVP